jgi:hypothetical protein
MPRALLLENIDPVARELLCSAGYEVQSLRGALDEDDLAAALDGVHDVLTPATGPLPRVPRWRRVSPPIMPTSTRCGEERNRSTRVWLKTGSPAPTSRTWSRPDTHPDELRRHRAHGPTGEPPIGGHEHPLLTTPHRHDSAPAPQSRRAQRMGHTQ